MYFFCMSLFLLFLLYCMKQIFKINFFKYFHYMFLSYFLNGCPSAYHVYIKLYDFTLIYTKLVPMRYRNDTLNMTLCTCLLLFVGPSAVNIVMYVCMNYVVVCCYSINLCNLLRFKKKRLYVWLLYFSLLNSHICLSSFVLDHLESFL